MSQKYDNYLQEHIENVKLAFTWIQTHLPTIILDGDYNHILENHDKSKYDPDEYDAYDSYFYGKNKSYEVCLEFNYAWLHHIHHNPHHWQYWVLINDDPENGIVALDMPYEYIIEMICDWWSFSWKSGNLYGIFDWYDEHKNSMILSDETQKTVEDILNKIERYLNKQDEQRDSDEWDS